MTAPGPAGVPSASSAPTVAIASLDAVWLGTAGPATNRAHALSGSSGERGLGAPGRCGGRRAPARRRTWRRAPPRTHSPVAGPTPFTQDSRLSRDRGLLASQCSGGMCESSVEHWPRLPRGLGCSATASPPSMTRTVRSVTPTSTARPTSASGTEWCMWPTRTWWSGTTLGRYQSQVSQRDGGSDSRCGSSSSGRSSRDAP